MRKYGRGWFGESARHSLAARGYRTYAKKRMDLGFLERQQLEIEERGLAKKRMKSPPVSIAERRAMRESPEFEREEYLRARLGEQRIDDRFQNELTEDERKDATRELKKVRELLADDPDNEELLVLEADLLDLLEFEGVDPQGFQGIDQPQFPRIPRDVNEQIIPSGPRFVPTPIAKDVPASVVEDVPVRPRATAKNLKPYLDKGYSQEAARQLLKKGIRPEGLGFVGEARKDAPGRKESRRAKKEKKPMSEAQMEFKKKQKGIAAFERLTELKQR